MVEQKLTIFAVFLVNISELRRAIEYRCKDFDEIDDLRNRRVNIPGLERTYVTPESVFW